MANKTLVAVFSASGVTKRVGEEIARVSGGDFFEIVPVEKYTKSDLNWTNRKSRSSVEMNDPSCRPEIAVEVKAGTPWRREAFLAPFAPVSRLAAS